MGIHHIIDEIQNAGSNLVIIKFFAEWCSHCVMIGPVVNKLCDELKTKVVFLEVDIDENADIARDENIVGIPTFVLYQNKKRLDVTTTESKLREMISKYK